MLNMDAIVVYSFVFIFGLIVGSFYNVIALRTLSGEKLSFPPSHCTKCNHRLSFLDLFPVFSYVFLKGKCRYCKAKISPIYPIGELLTASSYTIIISEFGFTMDGLIQIVFITVMIWATMTDLKSTFVPDRFVIIGLTLVLILRIIHGVDLVSYLIASAASFGLLLLILVLSKGKMGGADVKLYALIGLSIGLMDSVGSLFYASILGVLFQLPLIIANKGKVDREKEIPFVPFITLGVLCTYLFDLFHFTF